jgi:hypothetical protein
MNTDESCAVALASLVFVIGAAAVTVAAGQKPLAEFQVREMTSMRLRGEIYRAIKGYSEIYPYLVLERIRPGDTEGDPDKLVGQWPLTEMAGGHAFGRISEGDDITQVKWVGQSLEFVSKSMRGVEKCRVSKVDVKPTVSCERLKK